MRPKQAWKCLGERQNCLLWNCFGSLASFVFLQGEDEIEEAELKSLTALLVSLPQNYDQLCSLDLHRVLQGLEPSDAEHLLERVFMGVTQDASAGYDLLERGLKIVARSCSSCFLLYFWPVPNINFCLRRLSGKLMLRQLVKRYSSSLSNIWSHAAIGAIKQCVAADKLSSHANLLKMLERMQEDTEGKSQQNNSKSSSSKSTSVVWPCLGGLCNERLKDNSTTVGSVFQCV